MQGFSFFNVGIPVKQQETVAPQAPIHTAIH